MAKRTAIAVIGSGISGLGAAWLLSQRYDVTLYETESRPGGHSNTVDIHHGTTTLPVDTGFIVYNTASYPNLIALFAHLGVETAPTDMSFAVSLDRGGYEYAGSSLTTLFGQPANLLRAGHWRMLADTLRFFREAPGLGAEAADEHVTLGAYLAANRYSPEFVSRHILPMAAAIWSTPSVRVLDFPLASFVRFFANHGLLQIRDRPQWRTVVGGSRTYVQSMLRDGRIETLLGQSVHSVRRSATHALVRTPHGERRFDAVVIATHADDALALLTDADSDERRLLGAFPYVRNRAVLHGDTSLMPLRRRLWSSWNYIGRGNGTDAVLCVSYCMNKLQPLLASAPPLFVTLNPTHEPAHETVRAEFDYAHPMFDSRAMSAQRELWRLQGRRRTWFCGSYFGYGFHEDGLQSGLAAAEDIGGVRRPWQVPGESGRIHLRPADQARPPVLEAAE
jgi:predicted NAD/FAD-binding protein